MKKNFNCSSPNYLQINYLINYRAKNYYNNYNNNNQIDKSIFKYNLSRSKNRSTKTAKVSPVTIHKKIIRQINKSISKSKSVSKSKSKSKEKKKNNLGKNKNINYIFSNEYINKKLIKNHINNISKNRAKPKIDIFLNKSSQINKKQNIIHKLSNTKLNKYNIGLNHLLNRINQNNFKTTTSSGLNSTKSSKDKSKKNKLLKYNLKGNKHNSINKIKNIIIPKETNNKYKHNINIINKSLLITKNPLIRHLSKNIFHNYKTIKKLYKTKTDNKKIKKNYYNNNKTNLFLIKKISKVKNKFINNINIYTKTKNKNLNKNINNSSIIYYSKFYNNFSYTANSNSKSKSKSNSHKKVKIYKEKNKKKGITLHNTKIINKLSKKYIKKNKKENTNKKIKRKNKINNNTNINNKSAVIQSKEKEKEKQKQYIEKNIIDNKNINLNNSTISLNNINNNNYEEESNILSEKIKAYGKAHLYKSYPKTNISFYKIGRIIGRGAFGKVNLALHILSGYLVAMKSFNKNKLQIPLYKIKNEIKIMQKLRYNKNIVKLLEFFENEKYYFIIMENVIGGNLFTSINKMGYLPESLSKKIFKQLIETIKYIHSKGIVHRDIKPDNILLNLNNEIKLCDFGVSKEIKKGILIKDICGTPAFIAPEILLNKPYNPYMTDIWSCGIVLYLMSTGIFPFNGYNEHQLNKNILSGKFNKMNNVSNELIDLINKILELNPNKRISIDEILKHPWLNTNENNDINNNKDLFTKAEKIIYYKLRKNYKEKIDGDNLEHFSYRNIDTDYQDENLNSQTISIINTPFNSKRKKDYDDYDLYYDDVNIEIDIMKFMPKVNELNKLYEINNNSEYDQGFMFNKKENDNNKIMNSFNESYLKNKKEKKKREEKINKNENIVDNLIEYENKIENNNNDIFKYELTLDENIIKYVEKLGYKKEYLIKSLELNELNYATATYFLKLSLNDK